MAWYALRLSSDRDAPSRSLDSAPPSALRAGGLGRASKSFSQAGWRPSQCPSSRNNRRNIKTIGTLLSQKRITAEIRYVDKRNLQTYVKSAVTRSLAVPPFTQTARDFHVSLICALWIAASPDRLASRCGWTQKELRPMQQPQRCNDFKVSGYLVGAFESGRESEGLVIDLCCLLMTRC